MGNAVLLPSRASLREGAENPPLPSAAPPEEREEPEERPLRSPPPPRPYPETSDSRPIESVIQRAIREGMKDMSVEERLAFPSTHVAGPQLPNLIIIDFERIKALRESVVQNGPTAPFTEEIVNYISEASLAPYDWYSLARATLDAGDYLLWKGEYLEQCQEQAHANGGPDAQITYEMLAGLGQYVGVQSQLRKAWWALPARGDPEGAFSKCVQGPAESFSDFVARLTRAVRRSVRQEAAGDILIRHFVYENANADCKKWLTSLGRDSQVVGNERCHTCGGR